MKFKRAVVISNGTVKDKEFFIKLIQKSDFIIAVNGGSKHVRNFNLIPNVIIGDLDSIDEKDYLYFLKKKVDFKKYHPIKDKSDTHLAIEYAIDCGFKEILLLCVFGDRIDHILTNIFLLMKIVKAGIKGKIVDESYEIVLITKSGKIYGKIGDTVSLIPLTKTVTGIKLTGLKFKPETGKLKMSDTLGISNVFTKKVATIRIDKGKLLVIKPK